MTLGEAKQEVKRRQKKEPEKAWLVISQPAFDAILALAYSDGVQTNNPFISHDCETAMPVLLARGGMSKGSDGYKAMLHAIQLTITAAASEARRRKNTEE